MITDPSRSRTLDTARQSFELALNKGQGPDPVSFAGRYVAPTKADPTLTYATLKHELGEAEEFGNAVAKRGVRPFASHLGAAPILHEQQAMLGDPEAMRGMAKVRELHEGDAHVQKLIRSVGGTPDSPLPLGGRQHRALNRLIDQDTRPLGEQGRLLATRLGPDVVPYLPKDVQGPEALLEQTAKGLKGGWREKLDTVRGALPKFRRFESFVKRGV